MTKAFKIQGNDTTAKFKYLETIIPRLMNKNKSIQTIITPPTIVSHYIESTNKVLFKCCLFAGHVDKLAYHISGITKPSNEEETPEIICSLDCRGNGQTITLPLHKLSGEVDINLPVTDGSVLTMELSNDLFTINNASVSIIFHPRTHKKQTLPIEDSYERS